MISKEGHNAGSDMGKGDLVRGGRDKRKRLREGVAVDGCKATLVVSFWGYILVRAMGE